MRTLLAIGIAGIMALAPGTYAAETQPTAIATREKKADPLLYLKQRCEQNDEYNQLKNEGAVKGVLYNPTPSELETLCLEALTAFPEKDKMVKGQLARYAKAPAETIATVVPDTTAQIGSKTPMYVVFLKKFMEDPALADGDVDYILAHELQHIRDFFYGIHAGQAHLVFERGKKFNGDQFMKLTELRASYAEMKRLCTDMAKGTLACSQTEKDNAIKTLAERHLQAGKKWSDTPDGIATAAVVKECAGVNTYVADRNVCLSVDICGTKKTWAMPILTSKDVPQK